MPPLHWLMLCLQVIVIWPGFIRGHQSWQEIIWIALKKFQKLVRRLALLMFLIRIQAFRDPLRGDLPRVQIFTNDDPTRSCEMSSCSAIDLAEIRPSSKISSWIWSISSEVVTVLGRPGRGASQVEISPRLTGSPSFRRWHTMVHVSLMFVSEWREFPSQPCLARKKWLQLASWCCWNGARRLTCFLSASETRKDLQFDVWEDPSFQRHYRFRPTKSGRRSGWGFITTLSYKNHKIFRVSLLLPQITSASIYVFTSVWISFKFCRALPTIFQNVVWIRFLNCTYCKEQSRIEEDN